MSYLHFTIEERDALQAMNLMGLPMDEAARITGKHVSSLYRELTRNRKNGYYIARIADNQALRRRLESKDSPVRGNKGAHGYRGKTY